MKPKCRLRACLTPPKQTRRWETSCMKDDCYRNIIHESRLLNMKINLWKSPLSMKMDVWKRFFTPETHLSLKGEFDPAKAGKKMRDLMHEKRLVYETSVLEKRHMKESPIPEAYKRAHCTWKKTDYCRLRASLTPSWHARRSETWYMIIDLVHERRHHTWKEAYKRAHCTWKETY